MKRMTRVERMKQIVFTVEALNRWQKSLSGGDFDQIMSMTQIARAIKMSPSGHLRRLLNACVVAGWLNVAEIEYRAGIYAEYYDVTDLGKEMIREVTALDRMF